MHPTASKGWLLVLLSAWPSSCATPAPAARPCYAAKGIVMLFRSRGATNVDAEGLRSRVDALKGTQLVVGREEAAVVIAGGDVESYLAAKDALLPEARALGLDFTVEDRGAIDESCTVRLEHRDLPIERR